MIKIQFLKLLFFMLAGVLTAPAFSQILPAPPSEDCVSLGFDTKCADITIIDSLKALQLNPNEIAIAVNTTTDENRTCRKYETFLCPAGSTQEPQVSLTPIDTSQGCPFIDEFGELRLCDYKDVQQQDFLEICHVQTSKGIEAFTCSSLRFNTLFTCENRCLKDMCLIYFTSGQRVVGDCSWFQYDVLEGFDRGPDIDLDKPVILVR